jgi:hypothetical protein
MSPSPLCQYESCPLISTPHVMRQHFDRRQSFVRQCNLHVSPFLAFVSHLVTHSPSFVLRLCLLCSHLRVLTCISVSSFYLFSLWKVLHYSPFFLISFSIFIQSNFFNFLHHFRSIFDYFLIPSYYYILSSFLYLFYSFTLLPSIRPFVWSRSSDLVRFRDESGSDDALNFVCANLGRGATESVTMIRQMFGKESMSCTRKIQAYRDRKSETAEDQIQDHCSSLL